MEEEAVCGEDQAGKGRLPSPRPLTVADERVMRE